MDKADRLILFPCPFCGGKAEIISMSEKFTVSCGTGGCMANISYCSDKQSAVKAWNKRASDWIPCSERMPEPGVNVLVTDGINQMVTWHEVIDGKAMWVDNFIVYVNVRFGEVTHWMPLPELPGGDTDD